LFWEDRWLQGFRICELAPLVYDGVPKRARLARTVSAAMEDASWAGDIGPDITEAALQQFLLLWSRVVTVQLDMGTPDSITWAWEKDGMFSARSAYAARFAGLEVAPTAAFTWGSRAPLPCRFFAWLALRNRCWTSDRLAKRGLPHQDACPFCDQHEETMSHLMVSCTFSKDVWHWMSVATDRPELEPRADDTLGSWCLRQEQRRDQRRTMRALCLLGMWVIWTHRNDIVFNGASPSTVQVLRRIEREGRTWRQAGLLIGDLDGVFAGLVRWGFGE
jgi:hypothetical protein